jgi:hypothetical protein
MKQFVIAFDDSGGVEALCRWDGTPIAGDHPITVLTGFFVDRTAQADFEAQWNAVRRESQEQLGWDTPPPVHMRLMWGRTLPPRYRGQPNPYLGASFDDVHRWVSQYWAVVDEFVKRRLAGWFSNTLQRPAAAEAQRRYLQHPEFGQEMRFIRARSRRLYRGYHRLTNSPLLMLYTRSLLYAAETARATGPASIMDVLVDSFGDSHGIDAAETVAAMKAIASLDHIGTVERVADGDTSAPVQAADLIGFTRFRLEMAAGGYIQPDRVLAAIASRRDGISVTSANIPHKVRLRHGDLRFVAIPLHYALARAFVADRDPEFADEHLVGVAELRNRLHVVLANETVGVSVLTDAARTQPPAHMAKTPD